VEIAAIGSEAGAVLLRDLTAAERYAAMHVVDPLGRRFSGGAALAPLARIFPGGTTLAAVLAAFPGPTTWVYDLVARNRATFSRVLRPIV
jgi:predicted DCC family thiol-disulfide oxidoreductase YuxK